MTSLLNSGSTLLDKMEVFNCLTTFQLTQLTQLKQWSLLHANQPVVPQATPVPGFERLIMLPQIVDQDIPASTKQAFESTQKKSFLEDLGEVDDLFNGPTEESMFILNPEKDIDQEPDRTDFDDFLEFLEPGPCLPSITSLVADDKATTQAYYDLVHSQPNSPVHNQSNIPVQSHLNGSFNSPVQSLSSGSVHSPPNSPVNRPPNNQVHILTSGQLNSLANSPINRPPNSPVQGLFSDPVHSHPNSPSYSNPNSPTNSHTSSPSYSHPNSPAYSHPNSPAHSHPNSPAQSHPNSPIYSPPQSPCVSEAGSNPCSIDEGIGSQSDASDNESGDDYLDLSISSTVMSLPIKEAIEQQLSAMKEEPQLLPIKHERKKRGPRPQVKYRGDGPMQLWQFLLELLIAPEYTHLIKWTQDEDYEFKILKPSTVAKLWGEKKNKPTMNYEKLSRGLRYYYGKSVLEKVHGKRYVYQFKCNIPKILGYDPMAPVKCEDGVEDSVCGEPVMSPEEVEDLLVTSSVHGDGLLAFL